MTVVASGRHSLLRTQTQLGPDQPFVCAGWNTRAPRTSATADFQRCTACRQDIWADGRSFTRAIDNWVTRADDILARCQRLQSLAGSPPDAAKPLGLSLRSDATLTHGVQNPTFCRSAHQSAV
ncbi:hypothetical protein WJX73_006731 [Symbiochloris irregularis]|uniref:Uncharacterized protein n=1 Tax=Symbiochloris irregularis TaxID=706552 RepID=A0AAW1NPQ3_9CHLO